MEVLSPRTNGVAPVLNIIDRGSITAQQLTVIALCLLCNMLDGFDITAMAVAVNAIGGEMSLKEDRLGLLFSFALAGMMLGAMFLASVSDVIGRRKVMIASMAAIGISVLLTGYADNLWQLIGLRFLSGLGAGAMLASQAALASEYSSVKFRALSVAAVTAGYPLGAMATGLVAGELLPEYGWRSLFVLGGTITLAMALFVYWLIPESLQFLLEKRPPGALVQINKILLRLGREPLKELPLISAGRSGESSGVLANMLALLNPANRRTTLNLWLTFFVCFCTLYFLMSWIPKMVINTGLPEQTGNYAFSLFNMGGVLGIFLLGSLATRWKLTGLVSFFLISAATGMIIFALAPRDESLLLALIFVIGLMQQGGFCGLYAVAAKVYPTGIRSTGVGWAVGLGRFGAVIGPAVAGVTIASGVSMAGNFYLFAVPMLLGGVLAYRLQVE